MIGRKNLKHLLLTQTIPFIESFRLEKTRKIIPRPQLRQCQFSPAAQVQSGDIWRGMFILANEVLPNFKCVLERAVRGKTKKIFPSENVAGGASAKKKNSSASSEQVLTTQL